jgi:putative SOS response-associated peptidase YedK
MCGRVVVAMNSETLEKISRCKCTMNSIRSSQSYNMSPGRYLPVSYKVQDENILDWIKWGTINSDNFPLTNARSENFNKFYKNWNRCIIYINGYFEWKKITSSNDEEKILSTQPYYIKDSQSDHLMIAGIYKNSFNEVKYILI